MEIRGEGENVRYGVAGGNIAQVSVSAIPRGGARFREEIVRGREEKWKRTDKTEPGRLSEGRTCRARNAEWVCGTGRVSWPPGGAGTVKMAGLKGESRDFAQYR